VPPLVNRWYMATTATNMAGTTTRANVDATTTAPMATVPTTAVATSGVGMSCLPWCVDMSCFFCGRVWLTRGMLACWGGGVG
jgi:hypothetical protein